MGERKPSKLEALLSVLSFLIVVYPQALQPRVWWWVAMRASREGARRCGQLAILAEQRYRQEIG